MIFILFYFNLFLVILYFVDVEVSSFVEFVLLSIFFYFFHVLFHRLPILSKFLFLYHHIAFTDSLSEIIFFFILSLCLQAEEFVRDLSEHDVTSRCLTHDRTSLAAIRPEVVETKTKNARDLKKHGYGLQKELNIERLLEFSVIKHTLNLTCYKIK